MEKSIKYCTKKILFLTLLGSIYACNILPGNNKNEIEDLRKKTDISNIISLISLSNSNKTVTSSSTTSTTTLTSARVRKSTTTTTVNGTPLNISFDTADYDTGTYFSPSAPDKITVSTSGLYSILGQITFLTNTTGYRKVNLVLNDTSVPASTSVLANSGDGTSVSAQSISKLTSGDFIRLQAVQGSGGNLNLDNNSGYSQILTISRISE